MAWIAVMTLTAAVPLLLWRVGRLPVAAWPATVTALLIALGGYALSGRSALPGAPAGAGRGQVSVNEVAIRLRNEMGSGFGPQRNWLVASDGALRAGLPSAAVTYIRSGIRDHRESADLWLGLGNALVMRAEGLPTPAARLAYGEAARLDPDHPGPPFFLGAAELSIGNVDTARTLWRRALANSPEDARWRPRLAAAIARLQMER